PVNTGDLADLARAGGLDATVLGSGDIAAVVGTGSTAEAGADMAAPGNLDLAAVFGDMLNANATGGDFLFHILPSL
ncbi:MAG: hypothetical protein ACRDTN_10530, partial [Mycobacterium sp.]